MCVSTKVIWGEKTITKSLQLSNSVLRKTVTLELVLLMVPAVRWRIIFNTIWLKHLAGRIDFMPSVCRGALLVHWRWTPKFLHSTAPGRRRGDWASTGRRVNYPQLARIEALCETKRAGVSTVTVSNGCTSSATLDDPHSSSKSQHTHIPDSTLAAYRNFAVFPLSSNRTSPKQDEGNTKKRFLWCRKLEHRCPFTALFFNFIYLLHFML